MWPDGDVRTLYDPKVCLFSIANPSAFPPASGVFSWDVLSQGWLFAYAVRSPQYASACHATLLDIAPTSGNISVVNEKLGEGNWVYLGTFRCAIDNFTIVEWADKEFKRKKLEEAAKSLSR